MVGLSLVILNKDERCVLRQLGDSGDVQLLRTQPGNETAPLPPRDRGVELARCAGVLSRVEELRGSLKIPSPAQFGCAPIGMTLEQAEQTLSSIEQLARDILGRRELLAKRIAQLTAEWEKVSPYRELDLPLEPRDSHAFLHFVTGTLPPGNFERLRSEVGEEVLLLPVPQRRNVWPLAAMTTRQGRLALEGALQRAGFCFETLPDIEGATTASFCESAGRQQKELCLAMEQIEAELHLLAGTWSRQLEEIEAAANLERKLLEAERNFPRTEASVLVTGWVPSSNVAALEGRVRSAAGNRCVIEKISPDCFSGQQAPTLLRHSRWLRPFELLVANYGIPKYDELEPTLFVAISYVLMFGMMFGDAGHGAVLATCGLVAFLTGRSARLREGSLLLVFAGLSSMVFGLVYGSCFGLHQFKKYSLWHDPLEGNPMALMYAAIGIGIAMISLGLLLNIINRFRQRDVIGGLLDKFGLAGVVFYWGALLLLAEFPAIESRGLARPAIILFLLAPLAAWVLREPLEYVARRRVSDSSSPKGGFFEAIAESLVGAFEGVLSYLANTISFVRLAAYAMSHAALLVATFMIAEQLKHLPAGGGLLSVLMIILGNLVAILLEGLVASVQALRLEYYEFFGKFFSGEGRPFEPFCLQAART